MKTVASLPPNDIAELVKLLQREHLPCTSRIADPASGLDTTELLVDEQDYDRACDLIEDWQAAVAAERKRKFTRHCPKCQAQDWERVEDEHYAKTGLAVFRCKQCGCLVPGSITIVNKPSR